MVCKAWALERREGEGGWQGEREEKMERMKERERERTKKEEVNEVQAFTGNIVFTQEDQQGDELAFWIVHQRGLDLILNCIRHINPYFCLIPTTNSILGKI